MSHNPINLLVRFLLELAALFALGYWGWTQFDGILRFIVTIGAPLIAGWAWGVFRIPNDGGAPSVQVSGLIRLLIEAVFFGSATWGLFNAGAIQWGNIFGVIVLAHYIISYDRVIHMLRYNEGTG